MENDATLDQARKAKTVAKKRLETLRSVTGIGITRVDRGYGVKVNLSTPPSKTTDVPDAIDGVPVKIEITGPIQKR